MRLNLNAVEYRNFLSYGNQWTHFDIKSGIHLIIGEDVDRKRSNGSGKTSCLEPISYGLFGQTIKDLTKSRIINWKNKKNCEVKVYFTAITGESVIIHRGMKPNIFEVWVDDKKIETTAKITEFQKEIEQTYIGMDFKTFSGIVHSNPNNSISLLNTKKDQKRKFLENLFNIESYTQLVKHINLKLRDLNNKILVTDTDLKHKEELGKTCVDELNEIEVELAKIDTSDIQDNIVRISTEIDELKKVESFNYDIKELTDTKQSLRDNANNLDIEKEGYKTKRLELLAEKTSIKDRLTGIGDLTEKREKVATAQKRIDELEQIDFVSKFKEMSEKQGELAVLNGEYNELNTKLITEYANKRAELSNLPSTDDLKDRVDCPTCGQKVDYDSICDDVNSKREILLSERDEINHKIEILTENIKLNTENQRVITEEAKELEKQQTLLEKLKLIVESVDLKGKEKELEILTKRNESINKEVIELDNKIEDIDEKQQELWDEADRLNNLIRDYETASHNVTVKEQELNLEQQKLNLYEENKKSYKKRLDDKLQQKDKLAKEIKDLNRSINKSLTVKDYLEYIKLSLKDENVKQYAISSILPFLNRQTNKYLSETGHSFYLLIDGWLDAEIKGIGMDDCSFSNLSGGESKSIDLAIKFACIDIAKMMSTASTNILILDEILDSSIDSYGIQQLVDIVYYKQKEDNLAVYIVSHREEISEVGFDSIIKVIKEDGYSRIEQ